MTPRRMIAIAMLIGAGAFALAQSRERRWAKYESEMQDPVDDPADAWVESEFAFGRLRFRSPRDGRGWYARWGIDANKSDRQFIEGVRRLTRIHARSVEQIVDIDSDEIFDWPWMFAVSPGDWKLSPDQARRLRAYFDRGGFLMVDDFHGESEWRTFMAGIEQIFDDPQVVELDDGAAIFHVLYDLKDRVQIPGANVVHGPGYERDGVTPHWRGILDGQGRIVVAICFNMDVGDAWEFADDPHYPEKFASQAYRLGINYVLYAMTH
jgi:hypothetical protein